MRNNPSIEPDFYLAAFEETENWDASVTAKTGRIWTIALFDKTEHTHLCEFTPSYTLYPAYFFTERYLENDQDDLEVRQDWEACREVFYVHTHQVRPLVHLGNIFRDHKGEQFADWNNEEEYQATVDDYISEMVCNGEPLWFENGQWRTSDGPVDLAAA